MGKYTELHLVDATYEMDKGNFIYRIRQYVDSKDHTHVRITRVHTNNRLWMHGIMCETLNLGKQWIPQVNASNGVLDFHTIEDAIAFINEIESK